MSKQIGVKCPECGNDDRERFGVIGMARTKQEIYVYPDGTFVVSRYIYSEISKPVRGKTGDTLLTCRVCEHEFYTSKARPIEEGAMP